MKHANLVGEKLRLVRVARGLSLDDLGAAAQITRQYGHLIETGARTPTAELICVLSELLGVTPRFFHSRGEVPVMPEQCHFRKQLTTPLYVTSQVLARGTLLDSFVSSLDAAIRLPRVNFPSLPIKSAEDVERVAEECRRHWGLGLTGPITNMMRVTENAGAVVTYFGSVSDRVDAFSMDRPRPVVVRSSLKESLCRQRFDLAHECGHLVMHRGILTGDKITEDQAHKFASAFLLPRAGFIPEFPIGKALNWKRIFDLKLRWKVSARAIVRRAYDLRLITAQKFRTANIYFAKTGQIRIEKYDESMPIEQPELLEGALGGLEAKKPHLLRAIADELGWDSGLYGFLTGHVLPPPLPKLDGKVVPLRGK